MARNRYGILFILLLGILLPATDVRGEEDAPLRVLLLHSFGRDFPPFGSTTREFRSGLAERSRRPVEFLDASLEMARFEGESNEQPLTDFLAAVFVSQEPDLVAAVGAPAMFFILRNRATLFPTAPLITIAVEKRRLPSSGEAGPVASAFNDIDLGAIFRNIITILPNTRNLYVVGGVAEVDQYWLEQARREWIPIAPDINFHWMDDRPISRLKIELAELPPDSAVFCGILNRDAAGVPFLDQDALDQVRPHVAAPIFGFSTEQLGRGIVGGPLIDMGKVGRQAAAAGAAILAGKTPHEEDLQAVTLSPPAYDWRELERWKIPRSQLPPGSAILFQPASLWEDHRGLVLAAGAVLLTQSVLIALLIAARKRAVESDANLRLTTEAANLGLWISEDESKPVARCSSRWRELFGLPASGPVWRADILKCVHPEDREAVTRAVDDALAKGGSFEVEHRVIHGEDAERWISSRGQAHSGRTRGVSMDITERKQTEAQLERNRKELAHLSRVNTLGELSCALAHELNQPLGSILSNAQAARRLIVRDAPPVEEIREILADIVSEDLRASDVIKRLRALLERGEVHPVRLDMDECLDTVLELMRAELASRSIVVMRERSATAPIIMADRVQLQQVFLNLLSNSRDALVGQPADGRRIWLTTSVHDGTVQLKVQDSGAGFTGAPEELFKPFHTTKAHGLGMGLTICRSIIEAHNGHLWAEACQYEGSVFLLTLPDTSPS